MFPLLDVCLFVAGLLITVFGSKIMVESGKDLVSKLMFSGVVVGAVYFALITAIPETFTTLYAIYRVSGRIGFANLIGTNIHNIPLAIGISALLTSLTYERFANRICLIMLVSILFTSLLLIDGKMTQIKGLTLLFCYGLYVFYVIKYNKNNNYDKTIKASKSLKVIISTFIIGGIILLFGSRLIVYSSLSLAQNLGISSFYIGITIMALGPIIPEVAVSLAAALKGSGSISLGNVLGDNLFTIFVVLGLTGILRPFSITPIEFWLSIFPMFLISFLIFLITLKKSQKITKVDGIILLVFYIFILIIQTVYLA